MISLIHCLISKFLFNRYSISKLVIQAICSFGIFFSVSTEYEVFDISRSFSLRKLFPDLPFLVSVYILPIFSLASFIMFKIFLSLFIRFKERYRHCAWTFNTPISHLHWPSHRLPVFVSPVPSLLSVAYLSVLPATPYLAHNIITFFSVFLHMILVSFANGLYFRRYSLLRFFIFISNASSSLTSCVKFVIILKTKQHAFWY